MDEAVESQAIFGKHTGSARQNHGGFVMLALLLMAEILRQLISSSSHLFTGFHKSQVVVWDFLVSLFFPVKLHFAESTKQFQKTAR